MTEKVIRDTRLLEYLAETGLVGRSELRSATTRQKTNGGDIMDVLLASSLVEETALAKAVASFYQCPFVNLTRVRVHKQALQLVTGKFCREQLILPFGIEANTRDLQVAVSDPGNAEALEAVRYRSRDFTLKAYVAPRNQLREAVEFYYFGSGAAAAEGSSQPKMRRASNRAAGPRERTGFARRSSQTSSGVRANPGVQSESGLFLGSPGSDPSFLTMGGPQTDDLGSVPLPSIGDSSHGFRSSADEASNLPDVATSSNSGLSHSRLGSLNPFADVPAGQVAPQLAAKIQKLERRLEKLEKALKYEMKVSQALAEILVENGLLSSEQLKSRLRRG